MIKQLSTQLFAKALVQGMVSYTSFIMMENIAEYFYQGKFNGNINTFKLRSNQLVQRKSITNSYMIGLICCLGLIYGIQKFQKLNLYMFLLKLLGQKTEIELVHQSLSTLKELASSNHKLMQFAVDYSYFNSLNIISLSYQKKSIFTQLARTKLNYTRVISWTEFNKGVTNCLTHNQQYYTSLGKSFNPSKKTQEFLLVVLNKVIEIHPNKKQLEQCLKKELQSTGHSQIWDRILARS